MSTDKRYRRIFSVKEELLKKSREAALAAVQIFNNPNVTFKSETYVMLMNVAWTYLMHAYYRGMQIDYRYFIKGAHRKQFVRTKHGGYKHWDLEQCLDYKACPLDSQQVLNLKFLIGLRNEIEHQMTTRIDDYLSARFQACCINYHESVVALFGEKYGIAKHLTFSLQFASINNEQVETLSQLPGLPVNIRRYIEGFDGVLSSHDYQSTKFAYRLIFVPKTVNHLNQADQVIKFVPADSEIAQQVNKSFAIVKETEKPKFLPSGIVKLMKEEGFSRFGIHQHTELWKEMDAKGSGKSYGVSIGKAWYWYESWVNEVRKHCRANTTKYK